MLKKEKGSLANAISNVASTFTQALKSQVSVSAANNSVVVNQNTLPKSLSTGIMGIFLPVCSAELQSNKFQELRELQRLLEGNVIMAEEFAE